MVGILCSVFYVILIFNFYKNEWDSYMFIFNRGN